MITSLLHPPSSLAIADKIQQPSKKREAITSPKAELRSVPGERIGERARVVDGSTDRIDDDVCDRLWVFPLREEIECDPSRPCDREASDLDAFARAQLSNMDAHVRAAGLPSRQNGELVTVRREVSEPEQGGRRAVRDNPLTGGSLPGVGLRSELEPRGSKIDLIGDGSPCEVVHAVGHPLEDRTLGCQAFQRGLRDACSLCLPAGDQPPLIFGYLRQSSQGRRTSHACIVPRVRGLMKHHTFLSAAQTPMIGGLCSKPTFRTDLRHGRAPDGSSLSSFMTGRECDGLPTGSSPSPGVDPAWWTPED